MSKIQNPAHSTSTWTAIVAVPATEAGALSGFEATCKACGQTYGSSLKTTLQLDMQDHNRFMVKMRR